MKFYYSGYSQRNYGQIYEENILYVERYDRVYIFNMRDIVESILKYNQEYKDYSKFEEWNFDDELFDLENEEDKENYDELINGEYDEQGYLSKPSNVEEIDENKAVELIRSHLIIEMLKHDSCTVGDFKKILGKSFIRELSELIYQNRENYELF